MNEDRFKQLAALSVYGLRQIIKDADGCPGAVLGVETDYQDMTAEIERLKTMVKRMYEWIIDADINGEMDIWHYDGDIPHDNYWDWRGLLAEFELEATGKLDGYEPPSESEDVS